MTDPGQLGSLASRVAEHADGLDGVVHSIGNAPQSALGGNFLQTPWEDVAIALHTSTYSLKALAVAALPLMSSGGSIVGMDFDARVAWPGYDWMGVAKAGLESCARYLARDLGPRGIRVNLVSAGPLRTMAARSIPGFDDFRGLWEKRAPLGWNLSDPEPGRPRLRGAAVRLVPGHDRRDRARGRRRARDRRLTGARAGGPAAKRGRAGPWAAESGTSARAAHQVFGRPGRSSARRARRRNVCPIRSNRVTPTWWPTGPAMACDDIDRKL